MLDRIFYTCTARPVGKKGQLRKDEEGYYEVVLGALDAYSNAGDFYALKGSKELFDNSSHFQRRIAQGCLYAEFNHPQPLPGQKFQDFANRCANVEIKNACAHFKKIWLEYDKIRDEAGRPIVTIMGLVKPWGPYAQPLQDSLDNPSMNTCFSIRSFTADIPQPNGTLHRTLTEVITFDFVPESGIQQARKYSSPTLESLQVIPFKKSDLLQAVNGMTELAMESNRTFYTQMFDRIGWNVNADKPMVISSWV